MKNLEDLYNEVVQQIIEDVHCGDIDAIFELIKCNSIEGLISFLPEGQHKKFKNLKDQ
jgi:hypothetical protein